MARVTIPAQSVPLMLANGQVNPDWYPVFKFLEQLQPLSDIPADPSFAVGPLTPGNTSAATTARVVTDALNGSPGSDPGTSPIAIGIGSGSASVDSMTRIANCLTALFTNTTNLDAAVDDLNTRVTALENKENEVISDLDARFP